MSKLLDHIKAMAEMAKMHSTSFTIEMKRLPLKDIEEVAELVGEKVEYLQLGARLNFVLREKHGSKKEIGSVHLIQDSREWCAENIKLDQP